MSIDRLLLCDLTSCEMSYLSIIGEKPIVILPISDTSNKRLNSYQYLFTMMMLMGLEYGICALCLICW
jgi:hypothetical protein